MEQHEELDLEALVTRGLELLEDSGADALEGLCARHPARAAALRRRIDLLVAAGLLDVAGPDAEPRRVGPYVLGRALGGGGMGVVHEATEEGLGRSVAVKTIRPELLPFEHARARFTRELRVVAKLSHPGIVPVYGSGEEGGRPWFAMERIRGATLARVVDRLEGTPPDQLDGARLRDALGRAAGEPPEEGPALFEAPWSEVVATVGREVAAALDHAHRAGVLHRDVKPSNVLLGLDGRPRLIDFGCALPEAAEELTRTGALVGSLPYMAPEQTRGEAVDRRTDVYGLGATLIELATLAPPFLERGVAALQRAIVEGPAPSLRARSRRLPRDLETILLRAIERDPDRRYPSAAELARDLDRFLALEPVEARPPGLARRARSWTRRHPARATAAGFALAGALALQGILATANVRISRALDRAEVEAARARDNAATARAALIDVLADVADEDLALVPGFAPRREAALARAQALWAELEESNAELADPVQSALLEREHAEVLRLLGRDDEADARLDSAIHALEDRHAERAGDVAVLLELVDAWIDSTVGLARRGEYEDALARSRSAAEAVAPFTRASTDRATRASALARLRQAEHNAAVDSSRLDRPDAAREHLDAALDAAREWLALGPDDLDARAALAASWTLAGTLAASPGEALDALERARAILVELVLLDPSPEHRYRLGFTLGALGSRHLEAGDHDAARSAAREASATLEPLAAEHPYASRYLRRLAQANEVAAIADVRLGRAEDASPAFERNVEVLERLAALDPDDRSIAVGLAQALHNLANLRYELGDPAAAEALADRALARFEALVAERPSAGVRQFATLALLVREQARLARGGSVDVDALFATLDRDAGTDARAWSVLAATLATRSEDDPTRADAAVAALERAVDLGYDRADSLDADRAFDPLRERPDFQSLRGRLDR